MRQSLPVISLDLRISTSQAQYSCATPASAGTDAGMSGVPDNKPGTLGLNRRERRTNIRRWRLRIHCLDRRRPRDPKPRSDPRVRHPLRGKPPDQRPILQSDHSPIAVACSLFTGKTVQFSSGVDNSPSVHSAPFGLLCPNDSLAPRRSVSRKALLLALQL